MFGQGFNKSSQLLNFKTSNQGIPAANFLLVSAPPAMDWWTNYPITAVWMQNNNLFAGNATNNTFGNVSYPTPGAALGEVFIHDDFIVDADLVIQYTEIKMTGNARIVVQSGHVLIPSYCYLHACDYQPFSVYLPNCRTYLGLPNNPDYTLGALVGSPCDTLTVGLSEEEQEQAEIVISPNPFAKQFNVNAAHGSFAEDPEYKIFSVDGQLVQQGICLKNRSPQIDAGDLVAGVYVMHLQVGKKNIP